MLKNTPRTSVWGFLTRFKYSFSPSFHGVMWLADEEKEDLYYDKEEYEEKKGGSDDENIDEEE